MCLSERLGNLYNLMSTVPGKISSGTALAAYIDNVCLPECEHLLCLLADKQAYYRDSILLYPDGEGVRCDFADWTGKYHKLRKSLRKLPRGSELSAAAEKISVAVAATEQAANFPDDQKLKRIYANLHETYIKKYWPKECNRLKAFLQGLPNSRHRIRSLESELEGIEEILFEDGFLLPKQQEYCLTESELNTMLQDGADDGQIDDYEMTLALNSLYEDEGLAVVDEDAVARFIFRYRHELDWTMINSFFCYALKRKTLLAEIEKARAKYLNSSCLPVPKETKDYISDPAMLPAECQVFLFDKSKFPGFSRSINERVAVEIENQNNQQLWEVVKQIAQERGIVRSRLSREKFATLLHTICPKAGDPSKLRYNMEKYNPSPQQKANHKSLFSGMFE